MLYRFGQWQEGYILPPGFLPAEHKRAVHEPDRILLIHDARRYARGQGDPEIHDICQKMIHPAARGPELFTMIGLLGVEETLKRTEAVIAAVES